LESLVLEQAHRAVAVPEVRSVSELDDFLATCDDVLEDWSGSLDAQYCRWDGPEPEPASNYYMETQVPTVYYHELRETDNRQTQGGLHTQVRGNWFHASVGTVDRHLREHLRTNNVWAEVGYTTDAVTWDSETADPVGDMHQMVNYALRTGRSYTVVLDSVVMIFERMGRALGTTVNRVSRYAEADVLATTSRWALRPELLDPPERHVFYWKPPKACNVYEGWGYQRVVSEIPYVPGQLAVLDDLRRSAYWVREGGYRRGRR
jgi:hypothetical protein